MCCFGTCMTENSRAVCELAKPQHSRWTCNEITSKETLFQHQMFPWGQIYGQSCFRAPATNKVRWYISFVFSLRNPFHIIGSYFRYSLNSDSAVFIFEKHSNWIVFFGTMESQQKVIFKEYLSIVGEAEVIWPIEQMVILVYILLWYSLLRILRS